MTSFVEEEAKLHFSVPALKSYYQIRSISDVRIMMMPSGETCEEDCQRVWGTGIDAYITEPSSEAELAQSEVLP